MKDKIGYCRDALRLLKRKVICGKDCPIYGVAGETCPRLILEDATDTAIEKAIMAMIQIRGVK